ncbi:MAG: hypothetical protein ACI8QC_002363 [Planctomycetota bacterium]|jgi:hypothetical protein
MASQTKLQSWAPPAALLLLASWMLRGWRERWIPHDEGTLAGSALRVLAGQLPHRDYDEVYSGGLAYLHAALFAAFGERLDVLRLALVIPGLLLFLPCLYLMARRFAQPWAAAAIAAVAFAWGLPNYPAALPSWFNLMFALAAGEALLRSGEGQRPRTWRVLAGVCIGLSISIKIAGIYLLAAALVFLAMEEQRRAQSLDSELRGRLRGLHASILVLLAATLIGLLGTHAGAPELLHFFLPPCAATALLLVGERRSRGSRNERLQRLVGLGAPLLLGALLGCAPLVLTFLASGALGDLMRGLFILPATRLDHASWAPPPIAAALWSVPWILLLALAHKLPGRLCAVLVTALCLALPFGGQLGVYRAIWAGAQPLPSLLVLLAALLVVRASMPPVAQWLVLATAFTGLLQFPFSAPLYVAYVAPLAVLLGAWLGRDWHPRAAAAGLAFFGLFAVLWLHTGTLADFGWGYFQQRDLRPLASPRAQLWVHASEVREVDGLLEYLEQKAPPGLLWCGPDAPEIYALSGREDPTRGPFEFFAGDSKQQRLTFLEERAPKVIVINTQPGFSAPYSPEFQALLQQRYKTWVRMGRFLVGH